MNNYKRSMVEILFIILGGLLTVGLSIMAVIKGNKQEVETKKYQEESRRLQEETADLQIKLGEKSDQIIILNEELRKLSNSQANELKRMTKKIPSQVETLVNFTVPLTESEQNILRTFFGVKEEGQSNIITKSLYQQSGLNIAILNLLFTSSIELNLRFTGTKSAKEWQVGFRQFPTIFAEHHFADKGTFTLYYDEEFNLKLLGVLSSSSCTSNSHSLYDFDDYDLSLTIRFSKPVIIQDKQMYMTFFDETLVLEPGDIHIYLANESGFNFKTERFKKIRTNSFTTTGSLDLD